MVLEPHEGVGESRGSIIEVLIELIVKLAKKVWEAFLWVEKNA